MQSPNGQDYKKFGIAISYLIETVHLPLVIGANDSGTLTLNIDASFAVHPDCKSHTGACLTLGHGSVLSVSTKQKINTKIQSKLNSWDPTKGGSQDEQDSGWWPRLFS